MSDTTNLTTLALSGDLSVAGALSIAGVSVVTAVLLASGQAVDLNGEAGGLILDAAAVVVLQGATAGHGKLVISGTTVIDAISTGVAITGTQSVSGISTATGGLVVTGQTISGDGAITLKPLVGVQLSKGSAAAITIVAPTNVTHDWYTITVFSTTAFAHVITSSVDGFNAKGSSGTITLGGAIGDGFSLIAKGGHWYVTNTVNATVA